VSSDVTKLVSRILFQLAEDYSKQHIKWRGEGTTAPVRLCKKKMYIQISNLLKELFGPIVHSEMMQFGEDRTGKRRVMGHQFMIGLDGLDDLVEFHLGILTSTQRFEWRWKGETRADGAVVEELPSLLAFVGPDGVPLEEPKIWWEGTSFGKPLGWEQDEEEEGVQEENM
jgi:hypothetical protein